ncbi:MAG: hypothetical protein U9Q69_06105 [Nanoarchaeota archaeon]|nr:hypothetical protein [Nanoarchaeota archaeon]
MALKVKKICLFFVPSNRWRKTYPLQSLIFYVVGKRLYALKSYEKEECPSCKRMLDEKYRGNSEGRELSRRYFKWLKNSI